MQRSFGWQDEIDVFRMLIAFRVFVGVRVTAIRCPFFEPTRSHGCEARLQVSQLLHFPSHFFSCSLKC